MEDVLIEYGNTSCVKKMLTKYVSARNLTIMAELQRFCDRQKYKVIQFRFFGNYVISVTAYHIRALFPNWV